jgi:hypothetical protein
LAVLLVELGMLCYRLRLAGELEFVQPGVRASPGQ